MNMNNTVVDFYEGSDGPTVRIDAQETSAIQALVHVFEQLASQTEKSVEIAMLPTFRFLESIKSFALRSSTTTSSKKVTQVSPGVFEWLGTPDDWLDARDLTMPLLQGISGHQYLTDGLLDDATVEVALMEPRPAWVRRKLDANKPSN